MLIARDVSFAADDEKERTMMRTMPRLQYLLYVFQQLNIIASENHRYFCKNVTEGFFGTNFY